MVDRTKYSVANPEALGADAIPTTPGSTALPADTKGLVFSADDTISYAKEDGTGSQSGYPVLKGQVLPFIPGRVTAIAGGAIMFRII